MTVRSLLPLPATLEPVDCPLCEADKREILVRHDSFGFPIGLARCSHCGFVYCTPRPAERFMDHFYRYRYREFYEGRVRAGDEYIRSRRWDEAARDRVRRYAPWLPPGGRVLDVGCGAGKFLELLRVERPDTVVVGIEPNELLGRYARDVLGVPVHLDVYQSFTAPEPFDLVVAFHVMEHAHDLIGFLAFLRAQVSDAGHVAIESPNLDGSWETFHMFHLAHLYAFTPTSAAAVARRCGFDVVSCTAVEAGWDRSNFHMLLRPSNVVTAPLPAGLGPTEATLAKLRRVALPRWYCVLRSWTKLAVRRLGLEPLARRLRGERSD